MRTAIAVVLVLPFLAWAIIRIPGLESGPVLIPAMSFTPWVAAAAWLPVAAALVLRRPLVALVALVPAVALAAVVVPRALSGPHGAAADGPALTVLTANLRMGAADPAAVLALARSSDADLVSLQELTPEEMERLDAAGARRLYPYRAVQPRWGAQGSGLLARRPLTGVVKRADLRNAMPAATLRVPGAPPVRVQAIHPVTPLHDDASTWEQTLRALPRVTPGGELRLLAGDFNATLDHHALRSLIAGGYVDAGDAAGIGLQGTYPSDRTLRIAIDHVLVDRRARVASATVHRLAGSDHRALVARIVLPQSAKR